MPTLEPRFVCLFGYASYYLFTLFLIWSGAI
jgi:hypothetical protein